ncbi:MAG: phytoene/squalene synthase family protein [Actinobacteria bacterium]|jgi:phytoene synthase|nr:phytoene/squalene synthase family protein [Actinomycetota bacterium]NDA41506.1 phytoene/squalene synthase family protein [Actinomycetota bacterium]NDB31307.1 phytoene/squalene synthase family protein [Actinomycetota bacterium]NDE51133.1 phytoene/squalene synthase family protein [Actinomycetota bacterium]NDF42524.1 phytoene/squalene synthase family protein [Actinomycetota bacterium]
MDELTAAGITELELRKSYQECKRLNSEHGKTYYLATLLLPKEKRPHVHALYGFARFADEIVDDLGSTLSPQQKADALRQWGDGVLRDLNRGTSADHIGKALVNTVNTFQIPISYFEAFLHSMAMDLTVTSYERYEDLLEYVYGSAAVIGLQMVHVLGLANSANSSDKKKEALVAAEKLGIAFQLANFIRDVGEDLDRGRVYLPLSELREYQVSRAMLEERKVTPEIRNALTFQISRVRQLQREAEPGISLLTPSARPCIQAASELYCGIVDEVERIDCEVFSRRAKTSTFRRVTVAFPAWLRALALR